MTSSGYGSQAVSTLTLSSEDSASIKSIEENSEGSSHQQLHQQSKTASCEPEKNIEESCIKKDGQDDTQNIPLKMEAPSFSPFVETSNSPPQDSTLSALSKSDFDPQSFHGRRVAEVTEDAKYGEIEGKEEFEEDLIIREEGDDESKEKDILSNEAENDPYSLNVTEELEKLAVDVEDDDEEKQGILSSSPCIGQTLQSKTAISQDVLPSRPRISEKAGAQEDKDKTHIIIRSSPLPVGKQTDTSMLDEEHKTSSLETKKTSGNSGKRKGSGVRPRPMSMVVSPQAERLTKAWQEDLKQCSDSMSSDEHLTSKSIHFQLMDIGQ